MALVPERLISYRIYSGAASTELLGTSDVELPKFEAMTESIAGAGIAGDVESVVLGHFKSMQLTLKLLVPTRAAMILMAPQMQILDIRGSAQVQDPMLGVVLSQPLRISVRGMATGFGLGKFEPGKRMDSDIKIEICAITIWQNGEEIISLDKFNMSYKVLGFDHLQQVRRDMGGVG